ncbi:15543_t:CDS:2, partial [Cetraspora pellucida]
MLYFRSYIFVFLLNCIFTFAAAFIPNARYHHSSVLIDNKLYFSDVLIPWVDLTYTGGPQKAYATACIGGKNNDMIFILVVWINITSSGSVPTDRDEISCAKFNDGLMAIFSGYSYTPYAITNELWIFNTLTLTWNLNSAINVPSSRRSYCAITLPDDNILYIGGLNISMNN